MVYSVRSLSLNSATQESGNQESTLQLVCLLLMTKPFGLFIWTVLQEPDGLLILFTLLSWPSIFLYPSFIPHLLEIENVTFLCNSEKREPDIEQSVCLLQQITARIIRTRVSLPTLFVLNFNRD